VLETVLCTVGLCLHCLVYCPFQVRHFHAQIIWVCGKTDIQQTWPQGMFLCSCELSTVYGHTYIRCTGARIQKDTIQFACSLGYFSSLGYCLRSHRVWCVVGAHQQSVRVHQGVCELLSAGLRVNMCTISAIQQQQQLSACTPLLPCWFSY
jgi:hypothetical protein